MTRTREELRESLMAVLSAVPEMPEDGREHLADVFLDELQGSFELVPRGRSRRAQRMPAWDGLLAAAIRWWPVLAVTVAVIVLLPLLVFSAFILLHPPILFFGLILFFLFRSRRHGMRRRPMQWR